MNQCSCYVTLGWGSFKCVSTPTTSNHLFMIFQPPFAVALMCATLLWGQKTASKTNFIYFQHHRPANSLTSISRQRMSMVTASVPRPCRVVPCCSSLRSLSSFHWFDSVADQRFKNTMENGKSDPTRDKSRPAQHTTNATGSHHSSH